MKGNINMTINELIDNQLNHIKLNYSQGTYNHYKSHLEHFLKWCKTHNIYNVSDFTHGEIIAYISELKSTCENITINKRVGILKRAFITSGIKNDYLQNIKKFKERKTTFDMVDYETLKLIRNHVKNFSDVGNCLTHKCVVLLLIDSGCRLNELVHIEKRNVNLAHGEIVLKTTKTKEDRLIYLSEVTVHELSKMMLLKTNHKFLLHNINNDRPVNAFDVNFIMKSLKKSLDIDKLHAHMFRHSLASILLENGADIKSVQILLGHRNLETTERYLHLTDKHVKSVFKDKYKLE